MHTTHKLVSFWKERLLPVMYQNISIPNNVSYTIIFNFIFVPRQLANSAAEIADAGEKGKVLAQRRAVFLAIIGATPPDSEALKGILNNGLLVTIKLWLDEILNLGLGGVDLLLHLLGSIAMLPVSKEMVTSSKLGKQVAAVEKHSICKGGMNEIAIKERVSKVKEEWSASVKRMKKVCGRFVFCCLVFCIRSFYKSY